MGVTKKDIYRDEECLFNVPGYLHGTLHGKRGELRHHKVHTLEARLFEFEDLLFDYRLESQVRGEEPRSEGPRGLVKRRNRQKQGREEKRGQRGGKEERKHFVQLVISRR